MKTVAQMTLILGALLCTVTATAAERPNIVLIMADDLGLGDVSYYQEELLSKQSLVPTPAIDALAKEGLWFTNGLDPIFHSEIPQSYVGQVQLRPDPLAR